MVRAKPRGREGRAGRRGLVGRDGNPPAAPTPRASGHPGGMGADSPGSCEARTRGKGAWLRNTHPGRACEGSRSFNPSGVVFSSRWNPGVRFATPTGWHPSGIGKEATGRGSAEFRNRIGVDFNSGSIPMLHRDQASVVESVMKTRGAFSGLPCAALNLGAGGGTLGSLQRPHTNCTTPNRFP
jgi:hypothetical protein